MTQRRTLTDVIIRNPNHGSQLSFKGPIPQQDDQYGNQSYDSRSIQQINQQNKNLKQLIARVQRQNLQNPRNHVQKLQQGGSNLRRRIQHNSQKIQQLTGIVQQQKEALSIYQKQIQQFQRNLMGIMKLDKDIHSKLVNPNTSSTLQKNVKNVLVALNAKAPYDKLIKMIENIKV